MILLGNKWVKSSDETLSRLIQLFIHYKNNDNREIRTNELVDIVFQVFLQCAQ